MKVERNDILLWQWHLCLLKADEQISSPSLVSKQTSSHFQLMSVGIPFNSIYSHYNSFMQNSVTFKISKRALVV